MLLLLPKYWKTKSANAKTKEGENGEIVLYSAEEQMLTERIMHEYVKKLLGNVDNPEEEEIESLCLLLTTVGSMLDIRKARGHLDVYFSLMKELMKNPNLTPRMKYILQVCCWSYFATISLTYVV